MSHDEIGGTVTRKERRKAYGNGRKPVVRRPFSAADHIRNDWTPDDLIDRLIGRAAGYNGMLRNYLCTAAHQLRVAGATIDRLEAALAEQMTVDGKPQYRGDSVGIGAVANISKRNQQPGRLSGSERAALKDFAALIYDAGESESLQAEAMVTGRKMLANVRKRALGGGSDREALMVTELDEETIAAIAATEGGREMVDASALMPVGVEDDGS